MRHVPAAGAGASWLNRRAGNACANSWWRRLCRISLSTAGPWLRFAPGPGPPVSTRARLRCFPPGAYGGHRSAYGACRPAHGRRRFGARSSAGGRGSDHPGGAPRAAGAECAASRGHPAGCGAARPSHNAPLALRSLYRTVDAVWLLPTTGARTSATTRSAQPWRHLRGGSPGLAERPVRGSGGDLGVPRPPARGRGAHRQGAGAAAAMRREAAALPGLFTAISVRGG